MGLGDLQYQDKIAEFKLFPTNLEEFITNLDERELLYDISTTKKINWVGEYNIPFIMLNSEIIDTIQNHDILDAVAKDLPTFMLRNIVFSHIENVGTIDVVVGNTVLVSEVIPKDATTYELDIFSGNAGIVVGSIATSDIGLRFNPRYNSDDPSSVIINTIETYVLMSKIISSSYTHKDILHEIPLMYKYFNYTFLFNKESIAVYNEEVDLSKWSKNMRIDEHPYNTPSDEYKSVEMDISNPSKVLDGLPGFSSEETDVKVDALTDPGVYRVPIKATEAEYAEKYLQGHPNVVSFEIKELAFVSPSQRDKNIRHSNKQTVKLYNKIRMVLEKLDDDEIKTICDDGFDTDADGVDGVDGVDAGGVDGVDAIDADAVDANKTVDNTGDADTTNDM